MAKDKRLLVGLLLIAVSVAVPVSGEGLVLSHSSSGPPPSGDWVVTGNESYYDEVIVLNGDLFVENGGSLTFQKVTLLMNCTYNGQYNIIVQPGGRFYILDGSVITSANPDKRIGLFFISEGSTLRMNNSELHECGWASPEGESALRICSSDAIIENSLISHSTEGIHIFTDGVIIRNNNITANDLTGIIVHFGNPTIRDNHISTNEVGMVIHWDASPTIWGNHLSLNDGEGISVNGYGSPTICNNTIMLNNGTGISVAGGNPTIFNNTITLNSNGGAIAVGNSNPVIRSNTIMLNKHQGILGLGSSLVIPDNNIASNNDGIVLFQSAGVIQGNVIERNMQVGTAFGSGVGIAILDYSKVTVQGNIVADNGGLGISCYNHSNPLIQGNIITSNAADGISCGENSLPEIHWNDIHGNKESGVRNYDPSVTVNATNNYWGDGPSTSSNVLYDPWLTESIFQVEITSPLSKETVSLTTTVSAKVDARSGVDKVDFYVDDQLEYSDHESPYIWNWDTTEYTETDHNITGTAYDVFGLRVSASVTVSVDNFLLAIRTPQSGMTVGETAIVSVQASHVSGIERVEFYLQDTLVHTGTEAPYQWSWHTKEYPNGEYTITVKAYNTIGRMKTSETRIEVENVEIPWWQTQPWTIMEVLIALGGLIIGMIGLRRRRG